MVGSGIQISKALQCCPICRTSLSSALHPSTQKNCGHQRSFRGARVVVAAKRLSKEEAAAGEWAALLSSREDEQPPEGVTAEELNKICNKGVKLMLSEDAEGLLTFQEELNEIGSIFSEADHKDAALFVYVLWKMCDHIIVDQTISLQGIYLEAFRKVFDILEDSGWSLVREDEEVEDVSLEDIPNLSYMQPL